MIYLHSWELSLSLSPLYVDSSTQLEPRKVKVAFFGYLLFLIASSEPYTVVS